MVFPTNNYVILGMQGTLVGDMASMIDFDLSMRSLTAELVTRKIKADELSIQVPLKIRKSKQSIANRSFTITHKSPSFINSLTVIKIFAMRIKDEKTVQIVDYMTT